MRRMKTRNQIEESKLALRDGNGNGEEHSGGRYEPDQDHSWLRAVRRVATDRVGRTDGIGQFSFGQEIDRNQRRSS